MLGHHNLSKKNYHRKPVSPWRLVVLLFILVFIGVIWLLIFLNGEQFILQTIKVSGNHRLSTEAIVTAAREMLTGRRAWFLNRDRYWFYSPRQLATALSSRFNRLAQVSVRTDDWQTLQIEVSERKTIALWCFAPFETLSLTGSNCFYLDETGLAFVSAPHFSSPPLIVIAGSEPTLASPMAGLDSTLPALKSQPLPRSVFSRLLDLRLTLEDFFQSTALNSAIVKQIQVTSDGDYRFHFADFDLLVTRMQTANEILNLLHSVFAVPVFTTELAAGAKLEYLDLRFGRKVFYRFRE